MISSATFRKSRRGEAAFTLVEMVAVIAILLTLMTAGVSIMNGTGTQSRRAGTDMITGMIEQARSTAITSRSYVVFAIAEPSDVVKADTQDNRLRLGLFKLDEWPGSGSPPAEVKGTQANRWQILNSGLVLLGNNDPGAEGLANMPNPMSETQIKVIYGNKNVTTHCMVFNPRGGLVYPAGSTSIVLRIAEGNYRGGKATANMRADQSKPSENRLKIGRITARPYQIDG